MPNFIVRVVLHRAKEPDDYEELHKDMAQKGYYRTILGSDGTKYQLPPAMYRAAGDNWTKEMIRDEVRQIANGTGFKNAVFVVESNGSCWIGLDTV